MLGFIWRQLRGRAGRSVAPLAGELVAATGFVVLTGPTTTSRRNVTGAVERNTRAAYDILVSPKGTRTPLQADRGLVTCLAALVPAALLRRLPAARLPAEE